MDFINFEFYLFLSGHGVRLKNISFQEITKLNARALAMLFGCNSGKLERDGRQLDPEGHANNFMIASVPSMLGFLWNITDKDVDQWTIKLLRYWIDEDGCQKDFVQCVADKRTEFQRVTNGAALVVYGLPNLMYCQKDY